MGNGSGKQGGLEDVTKRVESKMGSLQLTGRYHRLPKKLADDYTLQVKVLGSGYNGQVHAAKNKTTGAKVAVKGFKLHGVTKDKRDELETECEIFLAMDHPHVARLVDVYESKEELNLVMECMEGGELFERVTQRKKFTEKDAADAVWQMLLSINYIHSHGVVHRDLKLENFLYDSKDSNHLKLIDFGFSKIYGANDPKMQLSCGTLAYVAPEVLDKSYTSKCDLWSLGVITFILLSGYMPFSGDERKQVQMIKTGQYVVKKDIWAKVSENGTGFVKGVLEVNPTKRMSAEQALAHPWIHKRDELATGELDATIMDSLCKFSQASQFRRACMSMMAWSLTNEERASVRNAFIELDKDRSGTIQMSEFKKAIEEKLHISDEAAAGIFEALDQNHDEEIHYTDFLAAMMSSRIQVHDDLVKQAFQRFDTDNSGFITKDNLKQVLGDSYDGATVDQMISEADMKGDGQISYEEFIAYLRDGGANEEHQMAANAIIDKEIQNGSNTKQGPACRMKTSTFVPPAGLHASISSTTAQASQSVRDGAKKPEEKKKGACCDIQ